MYKLFFAPMSELRILPFGLSQSNPSGVRLHLKRIFFSRLPLRLGSGEGKKIFDCHSTLFREFLVFLFVTVGIHLYSFCVFDCGSCVQCIRFSLFLTLERLRYILILKNLSFKILRFGCSSFNTLWGNR